MIIEIYGGWTTFCIVFGLTLLFGVLLHQVARRFYTKDPVVKKFSITDLQHATTESEIDGLLKGINKTKSHSNVFKALKTHLWLDFPFMLVTYGSVFIGAMLLTDELGMIGDAFFAVVAWMQVIALLSDVYENIFLLVKINRFTRPNYRMFAKFYFTIFSQTPYVKWGISVFGGVSVFLCLLLFWLSGNYETSSLKYLSTIIVELIAIGVLVYILQPKAKVSGE